MAFKHTLKRGSTRPVLRYPLPGVDLTGASVMFLMSPRPGQPATVNAPAEIVAGALEYHWQHGDTDNAVMHYGEFEVVFPDGAVETFPADDYIRIEVKQDIGDGGTAAPPALIVLSGALVEAGGDVASGAGAVALALSGALVETGSDTAAGTGAVTNPTPGSISLSAALIEAGADTASGTASVGITASAALVEAGADTASGAASVSVSMSAALAETGADTASGSMNALNTAPTLDDIPTLSATAGMPFSYTGTASDAEGAVTWAWTGLPAGINASGATISGTPTAAGTATISATVTDTGGLTASRSATLTVSSSDPLLAAAYDLDFVNGTYKGGTLNELLAEAGTYQPRLYEYADGIIRSLPGSVIQRTTNGLEVWPGRTNACLRCRDLTNAIWTKVGIAAALDQVGKTNVANSATRITATEAGGTVLQAITLASSARFLSAYVKRLSGSGSLEMTLDGGTSWVAVEPSNVWRRLFIPAQTLSNPQFGFRIGDAGDSFAIDFVQNENGVTMTPPIATTTAAASSLNNRATTQNKPPMNDLAKGAFGLYFHGRMNALSGRGIFISDGGVATSATVDATGAVKFCGVIGPAGQWDFSKDNKVAGYKSINGVVRFSVNGGAVVTGSAALSPQLTHFDIGTNGNAASNMQGVCRRLAMFSEPIPDDSLMAMTAP